MERKNIITLILEKTMKLEQCILIKFLESQKLMINIMKHGRIVVI